MRTGNLVRHLLSAGRYDLLKMCFDFAINPNTQKERLQTIDALSEIIHHGEGVLTPHQMANMMEAHHLLLQIPVKTITSTELYLFENSVIQMTKENSVYTQIKIDGCVLNIPKDEISSAVNQIKQKGERLYTAKEVKEMAERGGSK